MVQLGVTENPKEKALKHPVPVDSTVVVLQPTTPPTAKTSCCTRRVTICISVTCVLLAMTIAGVLLTLYVRRDLCYTYWGSCGGQFYGDDIIYDSEFPVWSEVDFIQSSSGSSGSSVTILEEVIVNGEWQNGDHEDGDHQADHSGEHVPGHPAELIRVPPELTRRR